MGLVALLMVAGEIDNKYSDSEAKTMLDQSTKPVIRELLAFEQSRVVPSIQTKDPT